jgi:hypothetical protein
LVFRCVLGSEGCVLVPRSSGTPVATWAWPTWVVSQRRVLEAVFILLEFPSPLRRIFIGSHSLPPSLVRRIGPSYPKSIFHLLHYEPRVYMCNNVLGPWFLAVRSLEALFLHRKSPSPCFGCIFCVLAPFRPFEVALGSY